MESTAKPQQKARVGIITDSTACLPRELAEQYGIAIVPVELVFEGKVYRDGVDITAEQFYEMLKKAKRLPTTSPSSPGEYLEAFRHLGREREAILCITVTSRLSAMHDSARAAAQLAKEVLPGTTIALLDSGTSTMAQGFIALAAARAAAQGLELAEVEAAARRLLPRVNVVAMLDTLYYLAKGGRVPKAAAWISSLLQVKAILELRQGEVRLLVREHSRPRAVARLLEIISGDNRGQPLHAAVFHAAAPEAAAELREKISATFPCAELYLTPFTPVMGVHSGPGVLGVAFYYEE